MIDWANPKHKISKYFTLKEALYLPTWNRMATEEDGLNEPVKINLLRLFNKMDEVREFLGKPIYVHVAYRPAEYNALVGGAPMSAHVSGKAADWDCREDCDLTREKLLPELYRLDMRMENKPKSNWVHLDTAHVRPGANRFFYP